MDVTGQVVFLINGDNVNDVFNHSLINVKQVGV